MKAVFHITAAFAGSMSVVVAVASSMALQVRASDAGPDYGLVFPQDRVCRLDIRVRDSDWLAIAQDSQAIRVPADVTFEGLLFRHAGLRLTGRSYGVHARTTLAREQPPFRLTFDAASANRDTTLGGFTDLAFSTVALDPSRVRTNVIMELMRKAGLPAPATAFMRVFLERGEGPTYLGLYSILEVPSPLEARLDVHSFLRWLALNTIIGTTDVNGLTSHNHFVYSSPRHRDRLFWIPWHQTVMFERDHDPAGAQRTQDPAIDLFHDRVGQGSPLIRFLMDDPKSRTMYREQLRDLLSTVLEQSRVRALISAQHELIAPYVADWHNELADAAKQFNAAVYGPNGLLSYIEMRADAARRVLDRQSQPIG